VKGPYLLFMAFPEVRAAMREYGLTYAPEMEAASVCGFYFSRMAQRYDLPVINNSLHMRNHCITLDADTWGGKKPCSSNADCGGSGAGCVNGTCAFSFPGPLQCSSWAEIVDCVDNVTAMGVSNHSFFQDRFFLSIHNTTNQTSPPSACDGVNGAC